MLEIQFETFMGIIVLVVLIRNFRADSTWRLLDSKFRAPFRQAPNIYKEISVYTSEAEATIGRSNTVLIWAEANGIYLRVPFPINIFKPCLFLPWESYKVRSGENSKLCVLTFEAFPDLKLLCTNKAINVLIRKEAQQICTPG